MKYVFRFLWFIWHIILIIIIFIMYIIINFCSAIWHLNFNHFIEFGEKDFEWIEYKSRISGRKIFYKNPWQLLLNKKTEIE